ncbi:MAG TPA: YkgJ family cysteine cluster protein [Anaerohalosphaeraceae bacterium]|nr:YkgJ family cysteine cluster protein [Anaerohalosphaeraceae bacterium]
MSKKKAVKRKAKSDPCLGCTGLCCRYFALPIDTPEDWGDYDDIRWYLSHEDVTVFVEKGDWYLNIKNKCRHLNGENRCHNYHLRPKICRSYRTADCDRTSDEYDYELHFHNDRQMEEYMRIKFGPRVFEKLEKKKKKMKKKPRKVKP